MDKQKIAKTFRSAFARPRKRLAGGHLVIPQSPINLKTVMDACVEGDDDENAVTEFDAVEEFTEASGWRDKELVSFYWNPFGPTSWASSLHLLHDGNDSAYAYVEQEVEPCLALIAMLRSASDPGVVRILFENLIKENGTRLGLGMFGSLPTCTHNQAEKLIPEKTVRQCYFYWMDWADRAGYTDWITLADGVSASGRPHLERSLGILKRLPDSDNLHDWLKERLERSGRLSPRAKHAIFDAYFKQSYGPY